MNAIHRAPKMLGFAFLLQFVSSFSSGVFLQPALIVPGNISESMQRIASNPALMKSSILLDMVTALGIIFLGAMLFVNLREHGERLAVIAFGFYILEGALLAASRSEAFALLRISQEYRAGGAAADLQILAQLALETMNFAGLTLHMLAFCAGAILFYFLLAQASIVPRWLSLWGLITVIPLLIMTVLTMFDYPVPFLVAIPYVPFELVIGLWLLIRGAETRPRWRQSAPALPEMDSGHAVQR